MIQDEARQCIGLTEDESPVLRSAKARAQSQRHAQPFADECAVEALRGISAHDARADERMRVHIGKPQELLPVRLDMHRGACLKAYERSRRIIDFIAEDP